MGSLDEKTEHWVFCFPNSGQVGELYYCAHSFTSLRFVTSDTRAVGLATTSAGPRSLCSSCPLGCARDLSRTGQGTLCPYGLCSRHSTLLLHRHSTLPREERTSCFDHFMW
jgi:hypothetical protein